MRIFRRTRGALRGRADAVRASAVAHHDAVRRAAWWVAVVICAWSVVSSAAFETYSSGPLAIFLAPVVVVLAWRMPGRRTVVLAAGVVVLAALATDAILLWPGVMALVYLVVVEDPAPFPWLGWASGLVGSLVGLTWFYGPTPAPLLATALGGSLGLLVRALDRSRALEQEARQLQGQARWLEQRTGLARELHDVVGHHVTAMVVQAEAGLVGDPHHALREIGRLGRTTLGELDQLVVHLRDPDAELAVSAPPRLGDIDELLAAPLRLQGVDVRVEVDPDPGLDETGTLTVYRIAQEALTNIARHARARQVAVEVRRLDQHVRVRVSDDGVGLPAQIERGSGLVGIAERVGARGGVWELGARLGGGTILDVLLPVEAA